MSTNCRASTPYEIMEKNDAIEIKTLEDVCRYGLCRDMNCKNKNCLNFCHDSKNQVTEKYHEVAPPLIQNVLNTPRNQMIITMTAPELEQKEKTRYKLLPEAQPGGNILREPTEIEKIWLEHMEKLDD